MHVQNLTINVGGPSPIGLAMIAALIRGPESDDEPAAPDSVPSEYAAPVSLTPPTIGELWPGQGGIYVGLARGRDGAPDYHLVMAVNDSGKDLEWADALAWAKTLEVDGNTDFEVPTRFDSALIYANVQDKVDTGKWHWTSTQSSAGNAFSQVFSNGNQINNGKSYEGRARAVRRLTT